MSIKQGNNTIAGSVIIDNAPTSGSSNAVSSGGVYAALSGKVNTGHQVIDFQEPTSSNNYTWYRLYADGWVEQGGDATSQKPATVTLPVEMADTNYILIATGAYPGRDNTNSARWSDVTTWRKSTTTITLGGTTLGMCWQVSGMAAN